MKIGLTYDLKETICPTSAGLDDSLEEYDSPETIEAIETVFRAVGHDVIRLGGGKHFLQNIVDTRVDIVFNIAEGLGNHRSREAQVPAVLEMLDIAYSGSDAQSLAICLDKNVTKRLVASAGIRTPDWLFINDKNGLAQLENISPLLPAFVKPAYEGSSKGIRMGSRINTVIEASNLALRLLADYQQPVLIERFIPGDEITVGIIGNHNPRIVGIMRVLPKHGLDRFIYSLEVKRDWENIVDYECPAKLDKPTLNAIVEFSLQAYKTLGCRDFARVDFRLDLDNLPWFLEINPLPGLNPYSSDLPIMAKKMGWHYQRLILTMLESALERYKQCVPV